MHRQPISPPLTEVEPVMAEHELGVSFPAAYRAYLKEAKPAKPVFRPRRKEWGWDWGADRQTPAELLPLPFPHPDSYVNANAELDAREPRLEDFTNGQAHAVAWQAWDGECEVFEDQKTAGAVILQDHGCGFYTLLAVTGPLAGTVWWDGRATCELIIPLSLDHMGSARPVTFGEWLRHDSWDLLPPNWGRSPRSTS
ncbi:SMI1/KNR4 family protein [Streptomyces sp. NBC_00047]|uniref:SMI1/KNR4 family protein n=1 Tax=Streptomyces sp. NBC_00047 TaxID=2975627 RepID=UPI002251EE4C|nr:SMI1/KNR4 family protein [Streptomyces sp. NBC_00047]MCX5612738.1 SMI1/KNR4 family protein [Streptomyces sp. NBC_00047]